MSTDEAETLSLPSLAIVTILGYLLYRYFFSSPAGASSTSASTSSASGVGQQRYRFTPAQVDTVAGMFPQLSRRDIMWDLQRNGGSVQATTERVLSGRGLDTAPPSFQPHVPIANPESRASAVASLLRGDRKEEPDLITRYNLHARVRTSDKGKEKERDAGAESGNNNANGAAPASGSGTLNGWATTKDARQSILQRRRDEMILEARRKMMERDAARGGMN